MHKIICFVKENRISICISFFVSLLILVEWIFSGAFNFGTTKTLVSEYNAESIYIKGYSVSGNIYTKQKKNAYIMIPIQGDEEYLHLDIKSIDDIDCGIDIYFLDNNDEYVKYEAYEYSFSNNSESLNIVLPHQENDIKLVITGNFNKKIEIDGIATYGDLLIYNWKFLLWAVGVCIILFVVVLIIIDRIVKLPLCTGNIQLFFAVLLLGQILFLVCNLIARNYYWGSYFSPIGEDNYMDHFNMLSLLKNRDPYYSNASYPAMCFVLLKIIYRMLPNDIDLVESAFNLRANDISMFYFGIMVLLGIAIVYTLFKKYLDRFDNKNLYCWLLICSGPFLYTIQRGNIILLAFCGILVYTRYYDSEDKKKRYLAYLCLAFAASIKVYPALFGLLTLKTKRYKETLHLVLMGFISFIIPFFAFDGIATIREFLIGLSKAGEVMTSQGLGSSISLYNLIQIINEICHIDIKCSQVGLGIVTIILIILALMAKKEWETLFLIAVSCAWFPQFSFIYVLVLFYPAILIALNSDEGLSKVDIILLSILIIPLSLPYMPWIDKAVFVTLNNLPMSYSSLVINGIIVYFVLRISISVLVEYVIKEDNDKLKHKIEISSAATIALLVVCVTVVAHFKPYNGNYSFEGKGTKADPYEISTVEDFLEIVELSNKGETFGGVYFVQTNDITFDGVTSIDPIGWTEKDCMFNGIYDGQGYSLINYYSMSDNDEQMGVFGQLNGDIYNLNLINCNIAGGTTGGFAYYISSSGKISNCYINGQLYGYEAAAIAVINDGIIENTVAFVNLDATIIHEIADPSRDNHFKNTYSNIGTGKIAIGSDTFGHINNFVDRNNQSLLSDHELKHWELNDLYFAKVSN